MPLRTACSSCGKKLQVRDELAGKKVKCPDCGKVFIAAAPSATTADPAAIKPSPSKAPPAKTSPAKASPSKGGPPPMAKDDISLQPTLKKPIGRPVQDQDEDDDEFDDRPVTRGKAAGGAGSRRLLWIALAGVLFLGGAAGAYYYFFMGPPASVGPIVKKGSPAPPGGNAQPAPVALTAGDLAGEWGDHRKDGLDLTLNADGKGAYTLLARFVPGQPGRADVEIQVGEAKVMQGGGVRIAGRILSTRLLEDGAKLELVDYELKLTYVLARRKDAPKEKTQIAKVPEGPNVLTELVPGDSWLFVSVSGEAASSQAFGSEIVKNAEVVFQQMFGFPQADLERINIFSVASFEEMKQSALQGLGKGGNLDVGDGLVFLVQTKKPVKTVELFRSGAAFNQDKYVVEMRNDNTILYGTKSSLQSYSQKVGKTKAAGILARALNQAKSSMGMVAAVTLPAELTDEVGPFLKDAPPFVMSLLKTKAVLISVDQDTHLRLSATLILDDVGAAQEVKRAVDGLVGLAGSFLAAVGKDPNKGDMAKLAQQALKDMKITVADKELTIASQADVKAFTEAALKAARGVKAAAGDSNNLKQIALGWLNYHDVHKSLPPQIVGKGLSWRVAILPYIEQDQLYKQFKLDEPWDSEHNKKLIPLMPKIYASGGNAKPGFTFIQTFVGKKTINADPQKGMSLIKIADGSSNTLIVAEAAKAVEWTKPDDITVTDDEPIVLGGANPKVTMAAMADGSVRPLPRDLDQKILRLLIDPNDGTPIPDFEGSGPKKAPPPPVFKSAPKPPTPKKAEEKKLEPPGAKKVPEAKGNEQTAPDESARGKHWLPRHVAGLRQFFMTRPRQA